eukprot:COSAG05_NODE_2832_length_2590_cov_1.992373_1_plen_40_part_00
MRDPSTSEKHDFAAPQSRYVFAPTITPATQMQPMTKFLK